jgi:hypothetical protein
MLFALIVLGVFSRTILSECVGYGMDIHDGGSYFLNSESHEKFSFVSQFEGCHEDVAYNFLYDPDGREYVCSPTDMTPSGTDVWSKCPIDKAHMKSGDWSIVIMSDNGGEEPVAFERDFRLEVGPQETVYVRIY